MYSYVLLQSAFLRTSVLNFVLISLQSSFASPLPSQLSPPLPFPSPFKFYFPLSLPIFILMSLSTFLSTSILVPLPLPLLSQKFLSHFRCFFTRLPPRSSPS
jgi:hypothetical protein